MQTTVNGIRMAYTDEGEGAPLLLVHGFPFNRGIWSNQVDAFKANYRVIAPDLRGFGGSDAAAGPVPMLRFAEDLYALMKNLDLGPIILAGHSMGAYAALAFAKAFPLALRELVLIGTRAGADAPEAAFARLEMAEKVRSEGVSVVMEGLASRMLAPGNTDKAMAASVRAIMMESRSEGVIAALEGMAVRPDASVWLKQIKARTLVIAGADDAITPLSESEVLMMAIPGAQLKIIPKAGHLVAFEKAEAFNEALKIWLAWGSDETKRQISYSLNAPHART
jgi:pimeloyl-ACP methyl ester carboxylesterase